MIENLRANVIKIESTDIRLAFCMDQGTSGYQTYALLQNSILVSHENFDEN